MAFFPDKPADSDEIRLGAKQIRDNFDGIINDGIVIAKPPLYGEGIPAANLGQAGECYIDTKTGNQYLKNASGIWELKLSLEAPIEKLQMLGNCIGNKTIDAAYGNIITLTVVGALTISLAASANGYCRVLSLITTNGGAHVVTWPSTVRWHGGTAPTLTTETDVLSLMTIDNGLTWYGALFGSYSS